MSFTAIALSELAFQAFLEAGVGTLAEKFTETAIQKIDQLRKTIIDKLRGRSSKVDEAIEQIESGDSKALATLAKNLDVVMDEEPDFASNLNAMAQEIYAGKLQDNSSMEMNILGENATGTQIKNDVTNQGGENYTGTVTVTKNYYANPPQE